LKNKKQLKAKRIMATFYDSLPLSVVKQLVKAELMEAYRTTKVEIISYEFDEDIYGYDDDPESQELLQQLTVTATVEGDEDCFKEDYGKHPWLLEWDANMVQFTSLMRADQGEDKDASASRNLKPGGREYGKT
jgi:hypothetical protein